LLGFSDAIVKGEKNKLGSRENPNWMGYEDEENRRAISSTVKVKTHRLS